jgi:hypothetical protein
VYPAAQAELDALREQRAALEAALAADQAAQVGQTADDLSEASAETFLAKVTFTEFHSAFQSPRCCQESYVSFLQSAEQHSEPP